MNIEYLKGKRAAYYTLGCKLNFSETSSIANQLSAAGVEAVQRGETADICVINTCSVTAVADKKCRQAIHKIIRQNPGAYIVVTGCYAQLKPQEVCAIPGVDIVLGQDKKNQVIEHLNGLVKRSEAAHKTIPTKDLRDFVHSCSQGDRTRFFLKVQDGCDYYCTYCTIPYARGRSRNPSIDTLVAEAQSVARQGGREIVLTGVNIGDFGKSNGERFVDLIMALDAVEEIDRYRISSIEPNLLTPDVIEFVAQSRAFMPHFHIPLQSGSNQVLKLMHRRYERECFEQRVGYIKQLMPHAFIGVDVIVGTRGETDDYFDDSYNFISSLDVSQLHVFNYSERPGTAALRIEGKVSAEERERRSNLLMRLSDNKLHTFYQKHIGSKAQVLVERPHRGKPAYGFTSNYIRVEIDAKSVKENTILPVYLSGFNASGNALTAIIESYNEE